MVQNWSKDKKKSSKPNPTVGLMEPRRRFPPEKIELRSGVVKSKVAEATKDTAAQSQNKDSRDSL